MVRLSVLAAAFGAVAVGIGWVVSGGDFVVAAVVCAATTLVAWWLLRPFARGVLAPFELQLQRDLLGTQDTPELSVSLRAEGLVELAERRLMREHERLSRAQRRTQEAIREADALVAQRLSDERDAQVAVDDQLSQLADLVKMRDEHIAYLTNALGPPLTAAVTSTGLVLDGDLTAPQRTLVDLGRGAVASVADLLDHFRVNADSVLAGFSVTAQSVNLRDEVTRTVRAVAMEGERRGVQLVLRFAPDLPTRCAVDAQRLRHVLTNVVHHAIYRARDGGEVFISLGADLVFKPVNSNQHVLVVAVDDGGPAYDAKAMEGLLQGPVESPGADGEAPGTLMGLVLAHRLLRNAGGRLFVVAGDKNKGRLAFSFTVTDEPMEPVAPPYGQGSLAGKRALVVDHSEASRMVLTELLGRWGLQADAAATADEAFSLIEASPADEGFHILLLDRYLEGGDGTQLLRRIHHEWPARRQKTLLLGRMSTALVPLASDVRPLVGATADKPILPDQLLAGILKLLAPARRPPKVTGRAGRVDPNRRPVRLLVAEDNPVNQAFIARMLERKGHLVSIANNGGDVLDALDTATQPYDIILMDIQMPVLDGVQTTLIIRERERRTGKHTPIIAVTAHAMRGERERFLAAGMDAYIPKPVVEEHLLMAIESVLPPGFHATAPPTVVGAPSELDPEIVMPSPTLEVLDESRILNFVAGDEDFLVSLVELFSQTAPEQLSAIGDAITVEDPIALERAAHQLKGSVGNFAAERAKHWAYELEKLGKRGSVASARPVYELLCDEVDALGERLQALSASRR